MEQSTGFANMNQNEHTHHEGVANKMKRSLFFLAQGIIVAILLAGCSSEKIYYEDEYLTISGFDIIEEGYGAYGTITTKNGVQTELLMADVELLDKNGDTICKTFGSATDVPKDGSADFVVYLYDIEEGDLLSSDKIEAIDSYEISGLLSSEQLEYETTRMADETERLEDELDRKYPNEPRL